MSEKVKIAYPYALAVFMQARQDNSLQLWSEMLALAVNVVKDPIMSRMLGDPLISRNKMADFFIGVVGENFSVEGINLIRLLAINKRLTILPEIVALFDEHKAKIESLVTVVCAYPLEAAQQEILTRALTQRLNKICKIVVQINKDIIGGAILHIGDTVIDGSLRTGLTQMAVELRI